MPVELNEATASEYDFVALLDTSGSMGEPSKRFPGRSRWEEAQESIVALCRALEKFDADGIDIVTFGAGVNLIEGVTAQAVSDIFSSRSPRGSTPLAEALAVVIDKQKRTGKKTVALVFTDGIPDNQDAVAANITNASNALENDEDLTFLFIQIGDDARARAYLDKLDDQLTGKFDIVSVVSAAEADNFEPLQLITNAING